MKQLNYKKGRMGEGIARKYLEDKGYGWVDSNHVNYLGEIDLIMTKGDVLVFVEVKLKIGDRFGSPEEMVSRGKLARVQRVAEAYLTLNPKMAKKRTRLEVVCIVLGEDNKVDRITHYDSLQ